MQLYLDQTYPLHSLARVGIQQHHSPPDVVGSPGCLLRRPFPFDRCPKQAQSAPHGVDVKVRHYLPQILDMIQAAKDRGIRQVMINTNGVRIARDDRFLETLAKLNPVVYFQFDGLRRETYLEIRGEDLLDLKLRALDRMHQAGLDAVLVAAVETGINVDEVGPLLDFGIGHPAVRGMVFQPVTHVGRHIPFNPMERVTIPDVIHGIVEQTNGRFILEDFGPGALLLPHLSGELLRLR